MDNVLAGKVVKLISSSRDLEAARTEIRRIKAYVNARSAVGKELIAPLNKMIDDFLARHLTRIQSALKRRLIRAEERRVKVCVIEHILIDNFSVVYSKFFEESKMNEKQIEFDTKLDKCRELPKKCWCKSYIPLTSFDWLDIIESLYMINKYHSPFKKLDCLKTVINNSLKLASKGVKQLESRKDVSSDDLLPILIYAIISSSSPLLLVNIHYIDNFLPKEYAVEEEGFCLTTMLCATQYIEIADLDKLAREAEGAGCQYEGEEEESWTIVD